MLIKTGGYLEQSKIMTVCYILIKLNIKKWLSDTASLSYNLKCDYTVKFLKASNYRTVSIISLYY